VRREEERREQSPARIGEERNRISPVYCIYVMQKANSATAIAILSIYHSKECIDDTDFSLNAGPYL
jgi:hypothetical protein